MSIVMDSSPPSRRSRSCELQGLQDHHLDAMQREYIHRLPDHSTLVANIVHEGSRVVFFDQGIDIISTNAPYWPGHTLNREGQ